MASINIKGTEYPLKFTLDAMDAIEEATGKTIDGLSFGMKSKADRAESLTVLAELMKAGRKGKEPTPTAAQLRGLLSPGELLSAVKAEADAVSEGMRMETEEPEEGEEVDLVLEEIKKKESPEG